MLFGFGGDQVRDAEGPRDRPGDERVGGGNNGAQVAAPLVFANQRARLVRHDRQDARLHELRVPAVQLLARITRQRRQLKIQKLEDVERPGLVLLVEVVVLRFVGLAFEHAFVDEELCPFIIAVARKQRVVQVEKRQFHGLFACNLMVSRSSGSVIARRVRSE